MRNTFWSWCCSFSSSLFWLLLWICLWNRKSSESPFWLRCHIYNSNAYLERSDQICQKGLVLQMTSWKYLHCPFSYPKATSNEIKKRILKFNLTICRESEKSHGEWESYPFQFSGLDNSMDCKNHWTAKSLTRLSTYKFPSLSEKKIYFSIISVIDIDCGHPKNGKKWRKKKTKCQLGEGGMGSVWHEWGVLDMNLLGSGGIEWEGANVDIGDGYIALWRP